MAHSSRYHRRHSKLLFPVGALIFSKGVDRLMREGRLDPMPFFQRHAHGDWNQVSDETWYANNAALKIDGQLNSFYVVTREISLSIMSEADRSATMIRLPSER
ncbi:MULTISPECIES: hypothetical protein [Pseudomonas]|uniref:hypothetical protein n=1 Tax=Pseudomonas TaxID=286 RepID=UPI000F7CFB42|nr:hypothetical protein [Pseudomonas proteolytica]AZP72931.1 hypothetical protein EJJ20_30880 [Pseudomonas poae]NMZ40743.1 hypothetical protein [Pseudomonas proteolytica]